MEKFPQMPLLPVRARIDFPSISPRLLPLNMCPFDLIILILLLLTTCYDVIFDIID